MSLSDEDLIAAARREALARGYPDTLDAELTAREPQAQVLLSDPAYARGGGLLVVLDPATGAVLKAVRQL